MLNPLNFFKSFKLALALEEIQHKLFPTYCFILAVFLRNVTGSQCIREQGIQSHCMHISIHIRIYTRKKYIIIMCSDYFSLSLCFKKKAKRSFAAPNKINPEEVIGHCLHFISSSVHAELQISKRTEIVLISISYNRSPSDLK